MRRSCCREGEGGVRGFVGDGSVFQRSQGANSLCIRLRPVRPASGVAAGGPDSRQTAPNLRRGPKRSSCHAQKARTWPMTMGPAPMIMIVLMSLRFLICGGVALDREGQGGQAAGSRRTCCFLFTVRHTRTAVARSARSLTSLIAACQGRVPLPLDAATATCIQCVCVRD